MPRNENVPMDVNQNFTAEWTPEEWESIKTQRRRSRTGLRLRTISDEGGFTYPGAAPPRFGLALRFMNRFIW